MKNLHTITGVHNEIKDYLSAKDYSQPFVISASNLDREESIEYVIDTLCGPRSGRYQMTKPINELQSELTRVKDNGYLVKKVYFKSEVEESLVQISELLKAKMESRVPVFIIYGKGTLETEISDPEINRLVFNY